MPTPSVSTADLITVEVRNGQEARPHRLPILTAAAETSTERRRLGDRLLQQAGNLMRGERVSLAEAAGLPQNVTVHATIAGRSLTKSIQL
jgi:hypothetical protein